MHMITRTLASTQLTGPRYFPHFSEVLWLQLVNEHRDILNIDLRTFEADSKVQNLVDCAACQTWEMSAPGQRLPPDVHRAGIWIVNVSPRFSSRPDCEAKFLFPLFAISALSCVDTANTVSDWRSGSFNEWTKQKCWNSCAQIWMPRMCLLATYLKHSPVLRNTWVDGWCSTRL